MALTELSQEQIDSLRGSAKQTGAYKRVLDEFVNSGLAGADVTGEFTAKPSSVAQALKKYTKRDEYAGIEVIYSNQNGTETVALVRS